MTTEAELKELLGEIEELPDDYDDIPDWQKMDIEILKDFYELEARIESLILVLKAKGIMSEDLYIAAYEHFKEDVPLDESEDFLSKTVERFKTKYASLL